MSAVENKKSLGIVGGLASPASDDLFFNLVKSTPAGDGTGCFRVIMEQSPFDDEKAAADESFNPTARKLYVFNTITALEERKIDAVLLNCFISNTIIDDLKSSINTPIINLMDALSSFVRREHPQARRLGILTSSYVRKERLFESYFDTDSYELIYPAKRVQADSPELIHQACQELADKGAELIIPGLAELPLIFESLSARQLIPVIDSNQVYANYAAAYRGGAAEKTFKLGVVGGVGPSATVDFMDKIIKHTKAGRDQEHIRMVVEHNPQIPDRTVYLVSGGPDPTIPLYAACKRLEANGADLIAIPCNTAHAFIDRFQQYLSIPIVNMLVETVDIIRQQCANASVVGLLATTGTLQCRVYHELLEQTGYDALVPDEQHQEILMDVIFGEKGIKAGFTKGVCLRDFHHVIEHVVDRGADVIILGCTELPLLELPQKSVTILDPTDILAKKCVAMKPDQSGSALTF
jgi:aspartate racemase